MFNLIDKHIRNAFSDAAIQYDVLTSLHKEIGRELMGKINRVNDAPRILDVGMGTGWLTHRLQFFFPDALVVGIDFAPGMVEYSKLKYEDMHALLADARALPFKKETFDLIASNLSFQWVSDLPIVFKQCHDILNPGKELHFTMFGFNTFQELFASFTSCVPKKAVKLNRLPKRQDVEKALWEAGFSSVRVKEEIIKVHFPNAMALLRWMKDIGANRLNRKIYLGKELLAHVSRHYEVQYKDRLGVRATFEVLWIEARK